ncbi:MAG: MnhB domain-containing protein [Candidatus Bipolaricaulota bacterium]|nr:MnhB domain-containing protein [Candidatus Bipolaricaulota bacterium]
MRNFPLGMAVFAVILVGCLCGVLIGGFGYRGAVDEAGAAYLLRAVEDTGAANMVSAIYLNYRLYDTLFELLVFSVAVLGVRFYLVGRNEEQVGSIPESQVVRTSADLLFPPILLLGIYLVLFGHLSPGGGFSGGVIAGTGLLLCAVALGAEVVARRFHEGILERLEWGVLLAVIILAIFPVAMGRVPLTDLLPTGRLGQLGSGGSILIYNGLIGIKVFIGTWVIIHYFMRHRGEI